MNTIIKPSIRKVIQKRNWPYIEHTLQNETTSLVCLKVGHTKNNNQTYPKTAEEIKKYKTAGNEIKTVAMSANNRASW